MSSTFEFTVIVRLVAQGWGVFHVFKKNRFLKKLKKLKKFKKFKKLGLGVSG
jgi:hypothetical protein